MGVGVLTESYLTSITRLQSFETGWTNHLFPLNLVSEQVRSQLINRYP